MAGITHTLDSTIATLTSRHDDCPAVSMRRGSLSDAVAMLNRWRLYTDDTGTHARIREACDNMLAI